MDTGWSVELQVPGEAKALSLIRNVVTTAAEDIGMAQEDVYKVEMAVDEICANIIEHAYRALGHPPPPIILQMRAEEGELVIDVVDYGPHFDYRAQKHHQFPDHWINHDFTRGAGLFLIKQCMDGLYYERLPQDRNLLRVKKKIKADT